MDQQYVKVGDLISLFSEENNGHVTTSGFAETLVYMTRCTDKEQTIPEFQDAVFEVHVFKNYACQAAFAKGLEAAGLEVSRPSRLGDNKELLMLKQALEVESRTNEATQDRALGQFLTYGQTIELKHVKSGKFLKISEIEAAAGDKDALACTVGGEDELSWFKVMPRYRLQSEGDRVHVGDKIMLLNVKTQHVLHTNASHAVDSTRLEVNGSTALSGFKVHTYCSFTTRELQDEILNGGEIVRFYSKECDGYLMVQDKVDQSEGNLLNQIVHIFSTPEGRSSSNSLFCIEHLMNNRGDLMKWEDSKIRLKHLGTGFYLSAAKPMDKTGQIGTESLKFFEVALTPDPRGSSTVFQLESLYPEEGEGFIKINSSFRLRSVASEAYLHILEEYWDKKNPQTKEQENQMVGVQEQSELRAKVCLCSKPFDEDSLVLVRVKDDEMTNINTVKAVVEPLQRFYRVMDEGKLPSIADRSRVQVILRDLIVFVQNVPEDKLRCDPLLLEEPTNYARQRVLLEQGIIDIVLNILRAPFEEVESDGKTKKKALMDIKQIQKNEDLKPYHYICQLCYRLLKQVIKDNPECERALSKPEIVGFMQTQLGYQLKTADTLMELFKDNRFLLDTLKDAHIDEFFKLIDEVGKLSRYMNFLNALVTCHGEGHPKNQEKICKLLLKTHARNCMIDVKLESGVVLVDFDTTKKPNERKGPDWRPIHQFLMDGDEEQLNYFEKLLTTMANLCIGRNKECSELVGERFPYDLCFAIATHHQIKGSQLPIRAAVMRIIRSVYVDCDPHMNLATINFTRVWGKFDSPEIPNRTYYVEPPQKGKKMSKSLTRVTNEQVIDLEPLKAFIKDWVGNCKSQNSAEEPKNNMTLAVLEPLSNLVMFGFFHSAHELADMMVALMVCLDGRDDRVGRDDADISNELRFTQSSSNLVIMMCKRQILHIFEIVASLRADLRLSLLLKLFYDRFQSGRYQEAGNGKKGFLSNTFSGAPSALLGGLKQATSVIRLGLRSKPRGEDGDLEDVFEMLQLTSPQGTPVEVLEDCTKYEYDPLVQEAFRTLIRNFNQREIMLKALHGTQLLISEESERIYNQVKHNCDTISRLISSKMSPESEKTVLDCMLDLEKIALKEKGVPNSINQQILRSANAHDVAHRLLRLPFSNELPKEQGRRDIFLSCYRFLLNFALKNGQNQSLLLNHVDFYMSQMGVKLKAADTITEIFRDNRQVCSQIEERTVRHFSEIIANRGQFPRYLRFLQIIITPEGRSLKRNQDLVLKMLLKRGDKIFVLFDDPEGKKERNKLFAEREHEKDPEGKLNYHAVLLSLMSDIVGNHNQLAEAKCSAIIPFDVCCATLKDKDCPDFIKASWTEFFRECYFEVERLDRSFDPEKQGNSAWDTLRILSEDLQKTLAEKRPAHPEFVRNYARLVETLFSKVFPAVGVSGKHGPDITIEVASALARVMEEESLPRREREAVVKAMTAVKESRISQREVLAIIPTEPTIRREQAKVKAQEPHEGTIETTVRKGFLLFVEDYKEKTGLGESDASREYEELVKIFMDDDPEKTAELPMSLSDPAVFQWGPRNQNTIKLVTLLAGMKGETDLKKMCLRVLRDLALYDNPPTVTQEMSQNRLDKLGEYTSRKAKGKTFGATTMMMRMICDPKHEDVLKESLELGIALLQDGNDQVQDRIYKYFVHDAEGMFFESMRDLIRRGCEEIKERKAYNLRIKEILSSSEAQDQDELLSSLPVFHERTHMMQVLRFIQLTCEGHNRKLQEYWRQQFAGVRSYDIVSEIANFLVELHASGIDNKNIDSVIQCLETLTELMQGPCKGNQTVLSVSKLPSTCNKILLQREFSGCSSDECLELQATTAVALSSLLEGCRDNKVPINIANDFDFDNVLNLLSDIEKDVATEPEGSIKVKCAYEIFCFILTIREYVAEVKTKVEQFQSEGQLAYFASKTGHIEIAHDGDIERIFFPIPRICANLTERSRQEVLWTVDRSSPGKKVEHFLEFADQLEEEMHHHEHLQSSKFFNFMSRIDFDRYGTNVAFWLAVLINLIMFLNYTLPHKAQRALQHTTRDATAQSPKQRAAVLLSTWTRTECTWLLVGLVLSSSWDFC